MQPWTKTNWTDAQQILEFADPKAHRKPDPAAIGTQPHLFVGQLISAGKLSEAVQFIGHALPRYESIVWAAQSMLAGTHADRADPAVNAVLRWIDDPCDELRREAYDKAMQAEDSPASLLGQAVFLSGGSISLPDLPPVLPPPDVCAKCTVAAVTIDADRHEDWRGSLRRAVDIGAGIASNGVGG